LDPHDSERRPLLEKYDFREPWDGPHNRAVGDIPLGAFTCPAYTKAHGPRPLTSYVAVVGPGTGWSDDGAGLGQSAHRRVPAVIEVGPAAVRWTEPTDISLQEVLRGLSSVHNGGANVAFSDGIVDFVSSEISRAELMSLLTGGRAPGW
jgi:prepilin-type processing-associated H-X9-DG protein